MAKFYLTTAIDYVNSRPHLGTAYEKITADVIARYQRLSGVETHFLMGNDEHSQNVFKAAEEAGKDPLAYCDEMEEAFREVWGRLDVSFDDFIRTTQPRHAESVKALLQKIVDAGDIYEDDYEGFYCVGCESFKAEADLEDGHCKVHTTKKADWIKERNYFFKLSKYQQPLLDLYEGNPGFLEPETWRNEILSRLRAGLEDRSITRAGQAWGIASPMNPEHVIYVWFDALINYITAVGYATDERLFEKWWPADVHIIGKDITFHHCILWPAMLMAAGVELPKRVFAHGWVHFKGEKMSKSLGTVVDPLDAAEKLGPDALRLYLVREIVYGADGDFSWERFEDRYNSDLANNLGNLVNRIAGMAKKYRKGELPQPAGEPGKLAAVAEQAVADYRAAMDRFALQEGANAAFRLVDATNEFITEQEPWAMAKAEAQADALSQVLYEIAEAVRIAAILLTPVMPSSCARILERVGVAEPGAMRLADAAWNTAGDRQTAAGDALWPRLEKSDG